jgi:hypothetical protein
MKVSIKDLSPIQSKPKNKPNKGNKGDTGDGNDRDNETDSSEGGDQSDEELEKEAEEIEKDLEKRAGNAKDLSGDPKKDSQNNKPGDDKQPSTPGTTQSDPRKSQHDSYTPKFSWKDLIKKFVRSKSESYSTYSRPNPKIATQISIAQQIGSTAIKPGQEIKQDALKLLMVFDCSGSMSGFISPAIQETAMLIKQTKSQISGVMPVIYFSVGITASYGIDTKEGSYWDIPNHDFSNLAKKATNKQPLKNLLDTNVNCGGTVFTPDLANKISQLVTKGYNTIIFTDSDITYSDNWTTFINLYNSHKSNIFLITGNQPQFDIICKKMGFVPNNFAHMGL